ncbi:unnamed protein product [Porites evermanni]|uniref:C2H2-type domain-containing protein n=1 Tax=Porites evermanni TaxID=104178 RepID=A0ABN8SNG4_9CNID|nr:unnamed protein product [Porites evermanni]
MACTFSLLVGGECGADPKSKTASRKIVPLVSCSKNISSHKKQLQFSGCETEIELILARSGCFQTPENIHDMTICPLHRVSLGIGWRRSKRVCSVPGKLSGHSEESKKNGERGCSLAQSKYILEATGEFIPVGSAICTQCRKNLTKQAHTPESSLPQSDFDELTEHLGELTLAETAAAQVIHVDERRESIFIPESDLEGSDFENTPHRSQVDTAKEPLKKLNDFLASRDVSPVRHKLSVPWESANERTKRRYSRKAKQSVQEVLEVIAPGQSDKLLTTLGESLPSERTQAEEEILQALAESYLNATHWSTRRQILSILADKLSLKELTHYIPGVTPYRFNIARHHRLLHGRGAIVPTDITRRMKGLDNFSAQGSKAIEDLSEIVDKIADQAKSQAWAKEMKQTLRSAKQYLRSDYKFCPNGITTWKAYNIGPGKLVPWKDIQTDGIFPATLEVLEPPDTRSQQSSFRKINPRKEVQQKSLSEQRLSSPDQQETAGQDMDVEKEKEEVSGLFTCPEDECIQTFQRSSSLQAHLDEGKHKRALEKETLFDKARKGYAARITGEQTKVPTFGFYAASKISVDKLHSTLEMGWALKTTRSRTQFTEEQRKFLTEQFLIGEECGKKADPQQVSQEMRRVRDEKAARIFSGKDILSPQQVAGFFSRLAARIRKTSATSNEESGSEDEEQCAVEAEALHSHLKEVVSEEIALRHPIVALSRNICSLVHTKKLSTLTVAVLRDICEDIGLNVDDITEKRKKPLISRITQVVKECSCARV